MPWTVSQISEVWLTYIEIHRHVAECPVRRLPRNLITTNNKSCTYLSCGFRQRKLRKAQTPLHGQRLRTCCTKPPTDELTTILQLVVQQIHHQRTKICHNLDMSRCWALALRCGKFVVQQVVELLWARPLVVLYNMSVAGVRVVEFGPKFLTLCALKIKNMNRINERSNQTGKLLW